MCWRVCLLVWSFIDVCVCVLFFGLFVVGFSVGVFLFIESFVVLIIL